MWKTTCLLVLPLLVIVNASVDLSGQLERDDIIEAVNSAETTWTAGRNFDENIKRSYIKNLLGLKIHPNGSVLLPPPDDGEDVDLELPSTFDAREKWPFCKTLQEIKDQGPCESVWAVAAAATLSDRFCVATKGEFNSHLSAQDLLSCCCCCSVSCGQGCKGGYDDRAWEYFFHKGICTGGDYESNEGCQPFTLPTCEHHMSGPRKNCSAYGDVPTPKCQSDCYNKDYKDHPKPQDLHKVKYAYTIGGDVRRIQREIYKYGPVEAGFYVYEDFLSYKKGVYQHITGAHVGRHAAKVIGWGTENNTDYWLVANSWNTDWGDNGFFKIKRGSDECYFESAVNFGYPDV